MVNILVSVVQLKGPAGSVAAADKRTTVSQLNLHGPLDKRITVSALSLEAPPGDKRTTVSEVQLVGPGSSLRPVYVGTAAGWVPADVYLPGPTGWVKVT